MSRKPLKFGRYDVASYSAFTMYSVCSLAIPLMIVAMGKDLGFPLDKGGMSAGGLLHAARCSLMIAALILCSLIASRIGKRLTMGFCVLFFGAGITACSFSVNYWMLLPCLVLVGFGEGICEGIATPFIQDLHSDAPERYVNIGHAFWSVGILAAVIFASGLLALGVSWRTILCSLGVLSMISSLFFLWKENPKKKYPETKDKIDLKVLWERTCLILKQKCFWRCCGAMFFGAGAEFGLTFWSAAYIELTFKTSVFVAGLGTGAIAVGMFIGRTFFGYIAKPERLRYINLYATLATIPLSLALVFLKPGVLPNWMTFTILFVLLFLCGLGIAPYWPTTQVFGVQKMPHCDSTLLYIYFSALGVPGCGFFSWFMGYMGDKLGDLRATILVVPCSLVVFICFTFYEGWLSRSNKKC
ncbi:MAG: MFS transporter [Lentisphaerae bacterium]|nr:MFS transporter [Lentisphaerota bacterium]